MKQRMEWLDAMRGFTMLLVVAYHTAIFGFGENEKLSTALPFIVLFRMPLFFFVSGFLAYKANFQWTLHSMGELTWKKIKIQLLPTLVFLCAFIIFRSNDHFWDRFLEIMKIPTKGGYWFTWVLLHMFVIYYTLQLICCRVRHQWIPVVVLWILSICAYETAYLPKLFSYPQEDFVNYTSFIQTIKYTQFFLFGNIVHRIWDKAEKVMDSQWFFPIVCTLAFFCCADFFRWHTMRFAWTNLPRTTAIYTLLIMTVMFFRHYKEWFTKEHVAGRTLQYIGTRTLDIYLLHFILLPKMPEIGTWLNANRPNFVIDLTLSIAFGALIIAFCLLVSNLLRISPVFKKYLFGR